MLRKQAVMSTATITIKTQRVLISAPLPFAKGERVNF